MKSLHLPLLGLLTMLCVISCKKEDLQNPSTLSPVSKSDSVAISFKTVSDWNTVADWNAVNQQKFSVYYCNIKDAKIAASDADNGLVLVYMKNNTTGAIVRLPYEDKADDHSNYWYYQVTGGNILVSCDASGTVKAPDQQISFKYVVSSGNTLGALEQNGLSRADIMNMPYNEVMKLSATAE